MAKNFSIMSLILWGGVLLAILFFVYGVGRREGFGSCSGRSNEKGCKAREGCTWTDGKCSITKYDKQKTCEYFNGTWTNGYCS